MRSRGDLGVAATCLFAAFGGEDRESDQEQARAMAGALILVEGLRELERIRKLLTPPKET
jgi:hypothetical protein